MKINERSFSSKKATETSLAVKALDAIDDPLVVLDDGGLITFANASWNAEAKNNRLADGALPKHTKIGSNYLAVCQRAKGYCSELSTDAFNGISDVLRGRRRAYELIYPCHSPKKQRWFLMTVKPLRGTRPRSVIVQHKEITELRLAEIAIQAQKVELALLVERMQQAAGAMKVLTNGNSIPNSFARLPVLRRGTVAPSGSEAFSPLSVLSKREHEVFDLIIQGQRNIEIALALSLSPKSVGTYRSRVLEKLKVRNSAELIAFATRLGLA